MHIEVASVSNVFTIGSEHLIVLQRSLATLPRELVSSTLFDCVERLAAQARPCRELPFAVQRSKEAILFAPEQVLVLVAHSNEVYYV